MPKKPSTLLLNIFLVINSAIILVPDKFKGIPVIGLLLSAIYYYVVNKSNNKFKFKLFFISTSFFLVLILSILYSEDLSYAFRKLETGLSLIAYPFVFVLIYNCKEKINKSVIKTLKWVFILTLVFFLVITFTYYFLTEPYYTFKSTIIHYHTLVDLRIIGYEIHSIYLSMHIGVAIIFLIDIIYNIKRPKVIYPILLLILLFVFLAILNKKGPIIGLGIVGILYFIKTKTKSKTALYFLIFGGIFMLTLVFIPKFNNINRFKELVDIEGLTKNPKSSTATRLMIYKCAIIQAIESPIIGYGWGDTRDVLNQCYEANPNISVRSYNTHNQFLSILLHAGVIGLLVFLYYFYYIFKFSNKNRNQLLFFLLLYFGLNMLSENILEREDGVIFYSFFINLFLFTSKLNESTET